LHPVAHTAGRTVSVGTFDRILTMPVTASAATMGSRDVAIYKQSMLAVPSTPDGTNNKNLNV
jgi:hypothetical protein